MCVADASIQAMPVPHCSLCRASSGNLGKTPIKPYVVHQCGAGFAALQAGMEIEWQTKMADKNVGSDIIVTWQRQGTAVVFMQHLAGCVVFMQQVVQAMQYGAT